MKDRQFTIKLTSGAEIQGTPTQAFNSLPIEEKKMFREPKKEIVEAVIDNTALGLEPVVNDIPPGSFKAGDKEPTVEQVAELDEWLTKIIESRKKIEEMKTREAELEKIISDEEKEKNKVVVTTPIIIDSTNIPNEELIDVINEKNDAEGTEQETLTPYEEFKKARMELSFSDIGIAHKLKSDEGKPDTYYGYYIKPSMDKDLMGNKTIKELADNNVTFREMEELLGPSAERVKQLLDEKYQNEKNITEPESPKVEEKPDDTKDLTGRTKMPFMYTVDEYLLHNDVHKSTTESSTKILKNLIKEALERNDYQNLIQEGRMTAENAKLVLMSAGLTVPEDIEKMINPKEETDDSELGIPVVIEKVADTDIVSTDTKQNEEVDEKETSVPENDAVVENIKSDAEKSKDARMAFSFENIEKEEGRDVYYAYYVRPSINLESIKDRKINEVKYDYNAYKEIDKLDGSSEEEARERLNKRYEEEL